MSTASSRGEPDSSNGLWRRVVNLLFRDGGEQSLRDQISEVIDDADEEDGAAGPAQDDLSTIERQMLRNMLRFGELTADDVGVPRSDIYALPESASFAEAVALFAEAGHSRLPVYRDSLDQITGMLHVKDLFAILATGATPPDSLAALIRQPRFVPQSMSALELLAEMRAHRTHLAIVLDEYTGTDGLVTIEDLIEEIVGDIEDEHDDAPEEQIIAREPGMWDVDARTELEDIAERIDARLADVEEDVETAGGLAVALAGHVPQPGEIVRHASGWRLEVLAGDERRVERLRLHAPGEVAAERAD
jgi:CBS domain containing-hemolysin-like protein